MTRNFIQITEENEEDRDKLYIEGDLLEFDGWTFSALVKPEPDPHSDRADSYPSQPHPPRH